MNNENCGLCKVRKGIIEKQNKLIQDLLERLCDANCEDCEYTQDCDSYEA